MSFVYPEFLWSLLLLAIPIILHLYNFRKYKVLYFSSLQFIKKVDQESKKTRNLKHLFILISRCLFFAFLVFAFAQPFIPQSIKGEKGGKTLIAIYIDNSFSMGQKGVEGELLSEAKEAAKRVVLSASNQELLVVITNDLDGAQQQVISKADALDRIDKIQLTPLAKNLEDILIWIKDFGNKYNTEFQKLASVKNVILSDFQSSTTKLTKKSNDSLSSYYPVQFLAQNPGNLSVDSIWFSNPNIRVNESNELNIRIKNHSNQAVKNAEIQVKVGTVSRDFFADIEANQSTTTQFTYREILKKGDNPIQKGMVSVLDKQMFFDDALFFSYVPKLSTSVLIVNGPDASPNVEKVFEQDLYYSITSISSESVTTDVLNNNNFVVLNGLNEVTPATANDYINFSKQKGSIFVFPGKKANEGGLNYLLSKVGLPLITSTTKEGTKIKKVEYTDPFFAPMFERTPQNLNLPAISIQYTGNGNQGIGLMQAQNGKTILSNSLDRKAFLFHSSLQEEFSNFTNNALFAAILLRSGELSEIVKPLFVTIGGSDKYPIERKTNTDEPYKLKSESIEFIPLMKNEGFIDYISFERMNASQALRAGHYEIMNAEFKGCVSLNYDRKESDVSIVDIEDLENNMNDLGYLNIRTLQIKDGQSKFEIELNKPVSIWKWFLIFSLLFFILEMALIKFLKN